MCSSATRVDLTRAQIERTRRLVDRALPAARVTGYEHHVARLSLPDPDDRHVLAAAIEVGADVIITFNLDDFPQCALESYETDALHPDVFVRSLYEACSSLRLYHRIVNMLTEFLPPLYERRRDNLAWLMTGIHEAEHS